MAQKATLINIKAISPKKRIMILSGIAGLVIGIVLVRQGMLTDDVMLRNVGIAIALLIGAGPSMMINMKAERKSESIDQYLPVFLLNLVGAMQSGMTLLRAVEQAADRDFGSLTHELQNLRANISWGMPYEEAFDQFGYRIGTVMGKRVAGVLFLALRSGGETSKTIEMIQRFVSDMRNLEKERKSAMKPYIITIYISFMVFLVTAILLVDNFFAEISNVQVDLKESIEKRGAERQGSGTFTALLGMDVAQLSDTLFHMSLVEALFGGLAAGKIGSGKFTSGIPHIIILIVITVIAFSIVGSGAVQVTELPGGVAPVEAPDIG